MLLSAPGATRDQFGTLWFCQQFVNWKMAISCHFIVDIVVSCPSKSADFHSDVKLHGRVDSMHIYIYIYRYIGMAYETMVLAYANISKSMML